MTTNEIHKRDGVVAVVFPNKLKCVNKNQRKLSDLKEWVKCFPPEEIFPRLRVNCDESKVSIDDDVNKSVDETEER